MLISPVWKGASSHPLDGQNLDTATDDARRWKVYLKQKKQYEEELAAAKAQDNEARLFIDQLRREIVKLKKGERNLQALIEAAARSSVR
jgi:hypothetical protein